MRRHLVILALAVLTPILVAASTPVTPECYYREVATPPSAVITHVVENPQYASEYWTPERMANAQPVPMPTPDFDPIEWVKPCDALGS